MSLSFDIKTGHGNVKLKNLVSDPNTQSGVNLANDYKRNSGTSYIDNAVKVETMDFSFEENNAQTSSSVYESRLAEIDDRYKVRTELRGEPDTYARLVKDIEEYNTLFGTGVINGDYIEYTDTDGQKKRINRFDAMIPSLMTNSLAYIGYLYKKLGDLDKFFKNPDPIIKDALYYIQDASLRLYHYLEATGTPFTENDISDVFFESKELQACISSTIDEHIDLAQKLLPENGKITIESKHLMPGYMTTSQQLASLKDYLNIPDKMLEIPGLKQLSQALILIKMISNELNNVAFLGHASSSTICEMTNDNGTYTLKLRYFIEDEYDWIKGQENVPGDVNIFEFGKLLRGEGKAFIVHIEKDVTITFKEGQAPSIEYHDIPIYKQ